MLQQLLDRLTCTFVAYTYSWSAKDGLPDFVDPLNLGASMRLTLLTLYSKLLHALLQNLQQIFKIPFIDPQAFHLVSLRESN